MSIYADVQRLDPGAVVELFELDATAIGGDLLRFHGYTQLGGITWQGHVYDAWPIEAEGFERTAQGTQPAPRLRVGNVAGSITALCLALDDLVGAQLVRHVTLGQYLDAVNYPGGNPTADATQELPPERWYVEVKTAETSEAVEFELASPMDLDGLQLPRRQIVATVCWWLGCGGYRGPYCGYTGTAYFDVQGNPVSNPAQDRCGGRLSDCKKRFGSTAELPYGSFPGADLIRT